MGIVTTVDYLSFLKNSGGIALCHGIFDVLHEGHLNYFEEAKKLSNTVVVSITSDRFVNKGPGRPHFDANTRARMIAALQCVDFVIINDEPRATNVIKALQPKYYVKGQDYKNRSDDLTGGILEEEEAIKSVGGEIVFTNRPTHSSSNLINKFFNSFSEEQNKTIAKINSLGGINTIRDIFSKIEKYYVTVIGEPIVDTYVFCEPEGISSKSPTVSARYINEENYAGGSLAIANHLSDFVRGVSLYAPHGNELYFQELKNNQINRRVMYNDTNLYSYITPRKTRYIDKDTKQRIFELTNITPKMWCNNDPRILLHNIKNSVVDSQVTLLCDFGHGLFEGSFLAGCSDLSGFIALNCQTNSSNFGFNPYKKHTNFNYLSIDLKEARVAFHDKHSDSKKLFEKIDARNVSVSMTLGPSGALYRHLSSSCTSPAFADKIVDTIGAGDAYYAITSLMVKANAPFEIVPFVGNIFAGLKTKIIGNKHSVTKAQLFKSIEAILK